MKLKAYHIGLLTFLFSSLALDLSLMGLTIYSFFTTKTAIGNGIMYILCFILISAFTILEIVNTFISFKEGSHFVKFLAYDDDNKIVNGVMVVAGIFVAIGLAMIIYNILLLCGLDIAFAKLLPPMEYIALCFAYLIFINALTVLVFPYFGREDKAMEMKSKRNKKRNLGM